MLPVNDPCHYSYAQSILKFHIIPRAIPSLAATSKGVDLPTLLTGQDLTFFKKGRGIFRNKE